MRKFLKFIHDDNCYCKYYEAVYILFHTGRMNPKTLQYLMGHSNIGVTMNVYTHLGFEDAAAEMMRMESVEAARKEQEKISAGRDQQDTTTQRMFRVI